MIDEDAVRQLPAAEQHRLLRLLVSLEAERLPPVDRRSVRWDIALLVIVACCVGLAAWIGVLAVTLPHFYRTGSWRGAWVGFDIGMLAVFAVTGWAAWRRRQLLIICLAVLATLLVCDAWFDVVLSVRSSNVWFSIASALLVELPLAALAALIARRLLRLSVGRIMRLEGMDDPVPPLWKVPLLGPDPAPLRRLYADASAGRKPGGRGGPRRRSRPAAAMEAAARGAARDGARPAARTDSGGPAGTGPGRSSGGVRAQHGGERGADVGVPETESGVE